MKIESVRWRAFFQRCDGVAESLHQKEKLVVRGGKSGGTLGQRLR